MADNRLTKNTNQFVISGNLTKDSELKTVGNGFNILSFSVANNYIQKSGDSYEQKVNYLDCKALGKSAERLANILKKGASVICTGEIRQERWQTQDGKTASRVVLQCESVEITRWPQNTQQNENAYAHQQQTFAQSQGDAGSFPEDLPPGFDPNGIPF